MSFGSSKSKSNSKSNTVQDPWSPTVPYLQSFLDKAGGVGGLDITPDQKLAFEALKTNAAQGNPFTPQIANVADQALNYTGAGQGQQISDAYTALQENLGGYARGDNLDPTSNPQLQALLKQVGDDIQWRTNRMFAGAGRDLSGANQGAVARGIASATAPLLLDQFNRNVDNQFAANQQLFSGAQTGATTQAQLDQIAQAIRAGGVDLSSAALDAKNYAPNKILEIDQEIQQLPYENLALLASILFPAAGLGATADSKSSGSSKSSGFGISLSDERAKENIRQVGHLNDGQPIYAFNYIGDDHLRLGLIAQQVEKVMPEAIVPLANGLKAVDYDIALSRSLEATHGVA